jgi:polyisoprenoid-binding protein YceI
MNEAENSGTLYRIDAGQSGFIVQAFAKGLLSFVGHNPNFAVGRYGGEIRFAAGNEQVDSVLIVIQTESIELLDKMSEKDSAEIENTMHEEVLESRQFPEIVFVSKDVSLRRISGGQYNVRADGFLTMHGETRQKRIEAEAEINDKRVRAEGEFMLAQSDFNIKEVKALGGTLKVKDEVKISFDITAEV